MLCNAPQEKNGPQAQKITRGRRVPKSQRNQQMWSHSSTNHIKLKIWSKIYSQQNEESEMHSHSCDIAVTVSYTPHHTTWYPQIKWIVVLELIVLVYTCTSTSNFFNFSFFVIGSSAFSVAVACFATSQWANGKIHLLRSMACIMLTITYYY